MTDLRARAQQHIQMVIDECNLSPLAKQSLEELLPLKGAHQRYRAIIVLRAIYRASGELNDKDQRIYRALHAVQALRTEVDECPQCLGDGGGLRGCPDCLSTGYKQGGAKP